MLRAPQVLTHVAHLLRPGFEYHQERPAEDGGGRVRLSLDQARARDIREDARKKVFIVCRLAVKM